MVPTVRAVLETIIFSLASVSMLATLVDAVSRHRRREARGSRPLRALAGGAMSLAVLLLGLRVVPDLLPAVCGWEYARPDPAGWAAAAAVGVAVLVRPLAGPGGEAALALYGVGWSMLSLGQLQRGYAAGRFFLWGAVFEWAAVILVSALVAWLFRRFAPRLRRLPVHADRPYPPGLWQILQAGSAAATAAVTVWIAVDFSFDGVGEAVALFGLAGRTAACPAALMLLGAAILMAWQSRGLWRAGWQYAAMAAGVLFTTSLGWSRLDLPADGVEPPWLAGSRNLMISSGMMTLLTSFGLARVLPRSGDWVTRARRAAPIFGGLAIVTLAVVVAGKYLQ
jgi:hypothetical protein